MKSKKSQAPAPRAQEIELKLALPTSDPASLAKRLARTPVLARRKATQQSLHNVYYDTPTQLLRRERIALRLRRVGGEGPAQWLQTLKTGGRDDSALSQRGEWETAVPDAALSLAALRATPWAALDPDGAVFRTLAPCFVTRFERTLWQVSRRDGSVVEVALDIGQIEAGDQTAPICELELELLAGAPAALFEVAQQIARSVAVLPASLSKAGRGYALAQDTLDQPQAAQLPALVSELPWPQAARQALRQMFGQFTANLNALRRSDDPELVHQARVGWRRFQSALRLYRPVLDVAGLPDWQSLQALLACLGAVRDLDVARTDTLPPLALAFIAGDARRATVWQSLLQELAQAATLQRKAVRYALQEPAVGATLLAASQWLEGLSAPGAAAAGVAGRKKFLRRWAQGRIQRLHQRVKRARQQAGTPERLHRVRLLAKRLRYGIEALQPLLTGKQPQRWYQQALRLQSGIGASRDLTQAAALLARLPADRGLVEFLRGLALGRQDPQSKCP
jgi:inorganic triphosphatase YgiF